MRIAMILKSRAALAAGIERAYLWQCEALAARGHEVLAICAPQSPVYRALKALKRKGTPLTIKPWLAPGALRGLRMAAPFVWRLLLNSLRPDCVVENDLRLRRWILTDACRGRWPLVSVFHASGGDFRWAPMTPQQLEDLLRSYHRVDSVWAVSACGRRTLQKCGVKTDRLRVIPNMTSPIVRDIRSRGDIVRIGALGRLTSRKGFDLLLRALALLKRRRLNFRAVIGGDGAEKDSLQALARQLRLGDNVTFPGWISDRRGFFTSIDAFFVPSRWETFGIVVLESWAHATPLAAMAVGGMAEIISHDKDGLLVPLESDDKTAQNIAASLERLASDESLRRRLALAGLKTLEQRYTPQVVGAQMERALEETIAAFKRRRLAA